MKPNKIGEQLIVNLCLILLPGHLYFCPVQNQSCPEQNIFCLKQNVFCLKQKSLPDAKKLMLVWQISKVSSICTIF